MQQLMKIAVSICRHLASVQLSGTCPCSLVGGEERRGAGGERDIALIMYQWNYWLSQFVSLNIMWLAGMNRLS